jgi:FkbM family methyltransferase
LSLRAEYGMSKTVSGILAGLVRAGTMYASPWRRAHLQLLVSELLHQRHQVITPFGPLWFVTTDARALGGPKNVLADEPETIDWIKGFQPNSVYWDVGTNVGQYAMIAALRGDIRVLAFEPAPRTYAALCVNIAENKLDVRASAYCVALSDVTRLGKLKMTRTHVASVLNSFEQDIDCFGDKIVAEYEQAALGISIDDFVNIFGARPPNYIKLDVDSTEVAILRGAAATLRSPNLISIIVENTKKESAQNDAIAALLRDAGFHPRKRGLGDNEYKVTNVIFEH